MSKYVCMYLENIQMINFTIKMQHNNFVFICLPLVKSILILDLYSHLTRCYLSWCMVPGYKDIKDQWIYEHASGNNLKIQNRQKLYLTILILKEKKPLRTYFSKEKNLQIWVLKGTVCKMLYCLRFYSTNPPTQPHTQKRAHYI